MTKPACHIENSNIGTAPSQLYGWDGAPVRIGVTGTGLHITDQSGMVVPKHDKMVFDESLAPATSTLIYSLGGVEVARKTISVVGAVMTIEMTYS